MSLFKKPKKKIRQRLQHNSDSDEDHPSLLRTAEDRKSNDKDERVKTANTLLSFDHDIEDGDGEVFKVKKSNYSRRIAKELEKERRRKKDEPTFDERNVENRKTVDVGKKTTSPPQPEIADKLSDLGIKVNNSIKILNSEELVQAQIPERSNDEDDNESQHSDEEVEDKHKSAVKFNRDRMTKVLQDGAIPDAATIFALKKQRQQMAGRGQEDFIPIKQDKENRTSSAGRFENQDDDDTDDEGRVSFSDIKNSRLDEMKKAALDSDHRMLISGNQFDRGDDCDEEDGEALRWEREQIRKGVATLAGANTTEFSRSPSPNSEDRNKVSALPPVQVPTDKSNLSLNSVLDRVRNRLITVREIVDRSQRQLAQAETELIVSAEAIEEIERDLPKLESSFRFYQEMRTYSMDLIECLDAKMPIIIALEGRLMSSLAQKGEKLVRRRRQDIQDQAEEVRGGSVDSALRRRATEREGRRVRRKSSRQAQGITGHHEGMSSDDEEAQSEKLILDKDKELVLSDAGHIFEDVNEDFNNLESVMKQFEIWKVSFNSSYQEAYIPLCVVKLTIPFVRLEMLNWNPLEDCSGVEKHSWYKTLLFFGYKVEQEDESDLMLIPKVIERAVVPKLSQYVERVWDPMSATQSRNLVRCVRKLAEDFPCFSNKSKPVAQFLLKVHSKLETSLKEDVFIPIVSKEVIDNPLSPTSQFLHRQFWSAVKLLQNMLLWQGLITEKALRELSIIGLLNRYLLFTLQCSIGHKDTVEKCTTIGSILPISWLKGDEALPELAMFSKFLFGLIRHLKSEYAPDEKIQSMTKLYESCSKLEYSDQRAKTK